MNPIAEARSSLPRPIAPWLSAVVLAFGLGAALPGSAKTPVAVLGAYVDGKDGDFAAALADDVTQALSEDTALLVYDLRKQNGGYLDSAHSAGRLRQPSLLAAMSGKRIVRGLLMECGEVREGFLCRLEAMDMQSSAPALYDSLVALPLAGERRELFGRAAAAAFGRMLRRERDGSASGAGTKEESGLAVLRLRAPAQPAMLIRGVAVIRRGAIDAVPLGATLVIMDAPRPTAATIDNIHYLLYPHSSYTYLLPKVVQLNEGTLGVLKGVDSASLEGQLRSAATLDKSNILWRTLTGLAALDSTNLIWKGLGRVASLDSGNLILKSLQKTAALDSTNPLFQALGRVTALDSSNLLLRTLAQVAAMDTTNLVWKGLGQVASLDSSNPIWSRLGKIVSLDSNGVWSKLGLLAFQDQSVILMPSCIVRGAPQALLLRQDGDLSTIEVVKGEVGIQPLLSSQPPGTAGALQVARTRGYALRVGRMPTARAGRLLREFESLDPGRAGRPFAFFLPDLLFGSGASLRTAGRPIQSLIRTEFRELDMEIDILSPGKEAWSDFQGGMRSGAQDAGCYLCSPDRLGP